MPPPLYARSATVFRAPLSCQKPNQHATITLAPISHPTPEPTNQSATTTTTRQRSLFEQNQDLFYLFSRFQHLKGKELHESMELREHAATVMSTLDRSINSLSVYDNFVNYLHSIGKLHRKVPGFKREHFWVSSSPFSVAHLPFNWQAVAPSSRSRDQGSCC